MGLTKNSTGNKLAVDTNILVNEDFDFIIGMTGNPNVGKSSIFNGLTGMHQHTGNWTGKTIESSFGVCNYKDKKILIADLPGTYSLSSYSKEEDVTYDFIASKNYDGLVIVVDATALERNLNLVLQILELTSKVVVCVNLLDEAEKKKIKIDLDKLSEMLGVPVIGTVAMKKDTLEKVKLKMCEITENEEAIRKFNNSEEIVEEASRIAEEVVSKEDMSLERNLKFDKILTSKKWGIPIMIGMLGVVFWITIVLANYPSKFLSWLFELGRDPLIYFFEFMNIPMWISNLLVDGVYQTVTWIVSVMLPPMAIFFPMFTLLEDVGVLPRIAFNLDNFFRKAGTSGKQALTMCMGFGCNAAGVVGCRIMTSTRERLIAIVTNCFVPCNGRFPILITIATIFFAGSVGGFTGSIISTFAVMLTILMGIFFSIMVSKILSKTLLKGESGGFFLELPPYRKPNVSSIIVRSILDRTLFVLGRAILSAVPAGIIIWLLANIDVNGFSMLYHIASFFDPFAKLMGLDGYILTAFIFGIPANEIVLPIVLMMYMNKGVMVNIESALEIGKVLMANGWTILTAINVMIFTILHFPCMTTLLTIRKESGSNKWVWVSFLIPTVLGVLVCMCTNFVYNLALMI